MTTLVDITETGARRGEDPLAYRQQQNFLTVLQTIGLRTNIEYSSGPKVITGIPKEKDLIIHTKLSADHEQLFRDAFWSDMEDEIRNTKDSLNFKARERRAKKKATANQGSHPSP